MKTVQLTISEELHQRLKFFAWTTRQTMADAHRQALEFTLPPLLGHEQQDAAPVNDNQADGEVKP